MATMSLGRIILLIILFNLSINITADHVFPAHAGKDLIFTSSLVSVITLYDIPLALLICGFNCRSFYFYF